MNRNTPKDSLIDIKIWSDIDYFAETASKVDIKQYKDILRSNRISSHDGSEEGAYFCAIPKSHCDSLEKAISLLFIIRYGDILGWNFCDYLIETDTEYIQFESWTTA